MTCSCKPHRHTSACNDVASFRYRCGLEPGDIEFCPLHRDSPELVRRFLTFWDESEKCDECRDQEMLCADTHLPEQLAIVEAMRKAGHDRGY